MNKLGASLQHRAFFSLCECVKVPLLSKERIGILPLFLKWVHCQTGEIGGVIS